MAITYIWKIRAIVTPNVTIGAITNVSMPVNATVDRELIQGNVFANTGRIDFESVELQFTTMMAKAAIDEIGLLGACIDGANYDVIVARYECNGPSAGSVHRQYRITKGIIFINSINCDHQGDMEVTCTLRAVWDGTTDPVTVTDDVALPASIANETDRWTLSGPETTTNEGGPGPDPISVINKRSVNVDFGVNVSSQGADSDPFDTFASIDSILPIVTVTGVDPTWFDSIGLGIFGTNVTHANTRIAYRKRTGAGGFVPNATPEHIQMTAYGPAYYDQLLNASGADAATSSYRIEAIEDDASNAPLIFNTATAIAPP